MHNPKWQTLSFVLVAVLLASSVVSAQTGTPVLQPITPDNAPDVQKLLRIDYGTGRMMAPSPDGSAIAVAGSQGIWLYDANSLITPPRRLDTVTGIHTIAFHPEGHVLASGGDDGSIRFWQLDDMREMQGFDEHEAPVTALSYHPDGDKLASGDADGMVSVWASSGGLRITMFQIHEGPVTSLAFSPNGRYLMTGSTDGTAGFYDVERLTMLGNTRDLANPVHAVTFNPTVNQVAFGTSANALLVDLDTNAVTPLDTGRGGARAAVYSPDGKWLATPGFMGSVAIWDTKTGERVKWFSVPPEQEDTAVGDPLSIAFSPDGTRLFVLHEGRVAAGGCLIRMWDIASQTVIAQEPTAFSFFQNVVFSPEGRYMAAVSSPTASRNLIHIWDARTFREIGRLTSPLGEKAIAFSREGRYLASSGNVPITAPPQERDALNDIRLWDTDTWNVASMMDGHSGFVQSLTFHPQFSNVLAAGTGVTTDDEPNGIYIWTIDNGEMLASMAGHEDWVRGLAFSPDGSLLVSSGQNEVNLWDWSHGEMVQSVPYDFTVNGLALAPDNAVLVVSSSAGMGSIRTLTPGTNEYELLPGYVSTTASTVAVNPAGTLVAIANTNKADILLFDLVNQQPVANLQDHAGNIYSLSFNPDGTVLASTAADGTVLLWGVPPVLP